MILALVLFMSADVATAPASITITFPETRALSPTFTTKVLPTALTLVTATPAGEEPEIPAEEEDEVDVPEAENSIVLYSGTGMEKTELPESIKLDVSKSKEASNLDDNYQSQITLSLPAADYKPEIDVVFVIDDTSSTSSIFVDATTKMLEELNSKENLNVNFGLVTFDSVARDWLNATTNGEVSGLVSLEDNYTTIIHAINQELSSEGTGQMKRIGGSNLEWPLEMAQDMLASGSFSVQDIVKVSAAGRGDMPDGGSCSYMINVGGIGLDARICARVNRQKDAGRSGRLLYLNSLIYNLVKSRPFRARVECDGDVIYDGRCLSIAFGLGKYSGGGFRQTPYAVMDDGLLDVTVIPVLPLHVIMTQAYRLLDGTFPGIKGIVSCKASSVSVTSLEYVGVIIEVDGEIVGSLPARLEILPGRLHVLHRSECFSGSTSMTKYERGEITWQ